MAGEINFDGLVGPTHNYAGLAYGNVASLQNKHARSHPKEAALQGLAKMKALMDLGIPQAVLPPQERPAMRVLRAQGYTGTVGTVLEQVWKRDRKLLMACCSASSMWAANAATITPSQDARDCKVHITPANLQTQYHRSIEVETTARILRCLFADERFFTVHPPLPGYAGCLDEGAANHTRLAVAQGQPGLHIFVYGVSHHRPGGYPARQTLSACQRIAASHQLAPEQVVYAEQSPLAIDAGVFHNDVIAVGHESLWLYHASAYHNEAGVMAEVQRKYRAMQQSELLSVRIVDDKLPLDEAISTYLFNSQIVSLPAGGMALIAPQECEQHAYASAVIAELIAATHNPIQSVHFFNLRQSMCNGGGPACLRLRVVLNEAERGAVQAHVMLHDTLYAALVHLVEKHYRDELRLEDLRDPSLYTESCTFLDELTQLLQLGAVYDFQQD